MAMEKQALEEQVLGKVLPITLNDVNREETGRGNSRTFRRARFATLGFLALLFGAAVWSPQDFTRSLSSKFPGVYDASKAQSGATGCPQVPALLPSAQTPALIDLDEYVQSEKFLNISVARLSGAVQIPTESFDDLGPIGEDKRWEIMYEFAAYLKETFPATHESVQLEKVNTHGLLYTWHGSDSSLKPTLLMAHQDVVPVPESTVDSWTHPPFSGYYDGKYVWGRGSWDCKSQLIGILGAVEELIKAGFKPRRTVILSFGFDEEVSGPQGAAHLAPFLLERYSANGIAAIVDEGAGFASSWGMQVALPGVGEKGYTDVQIVVRMPGGHSSIPSDHTSIGVMSDLITLIENRKYSPYLDDENPYLGLLTCGAEHAPDFPSKLKGLLKQRLASGSSKPKKGTDRLAMEVAKEGLAIRYLMQTSVAADVIQGGVKVNALPERTAATINHRINVGETPATVYSKITGLAKAMAYKYNLTLHAFDGVTEAPSSISLFPAHDDLAPSPVTPTESTLSPWTILSGTTRALYGTDVIVAPGIMTGNTDTKYYWDLTKHIFRFSPGWDSEAGDAGLGNIHTVNERVSAKSHVNLLRWVSLFVRNMDESELD
ncbi:hypothetical protein DV737_g5201, partial [Chaetothyriales sp. CBS 132003]